MTTQHAKSNAREGDGVAGVRDTLIVAANNPVAHGGLEGLRTVMRRQAERLDAIAAMQAEPVDVLRIARSKSLDPIVCYFEDYGAGQGRITIACFGNAWTAAWGAMSGRTVRQFVANVDAHYLSGSLLQLSGASKRHRDYTGRVAAAVIEALAPATGAPR